MKTSIHSFSEHRQMLNNLWVRVIVSVGVALGSVALCIAAWRHDWSGFIKFVGIAGIAAGIISIAADIPALLEERRAVRRLGRDRRHD